MARSRASIPTISATTSSVSCASWRVTLRCFSPSLGIGVLASQLGSVTVSSVPDEQSSEVGGLQNTVTNLGISIGTALTGAIIIAALTTSFPNGVQNNPAVPNSVKQQATTQLAGGAPFVSDAQLKTGLKQAHVPPNAANAIIKENQTARMDGLRSPLAVLAIVALIALFLTGRIPTAQPAAAEKQPTSGGKRPASGTAKNGAVTERPAAMTKPAASGTET